MQTPKLQELQGASRLGLGFFNNLIRRVECTKPVAGDGVVCEDRADGIMVSLSAAGKKISGATAVTINVCSNGSPYKLVVLVDAELTREANASG